MKILHTVESYYPSIGGMQEVVRQISERLAKRGHDVTVATALSSRRENKVINGVKVAEFNVSGNLVQGLKGDVTHYRDFLLNADFDIIVNFAAQQWATDIAFSVLERIKGIKIFVPTGFSALFHPKYAAYYSSMKSWLQKYDMNIFHSNKYRDIRFARDCGTEGVTVITNGASEEEFLNDDRPDIRNKFNIPLDHFLVLHVGSHTGLKGHAEAIKIFCKASIENATLLIVGNDSGGGCGQVCKAKSLLFKSNILRGRNGKRLIVTSSLSRSETVAAYLAADLFLFPSNVECSPLVLFECLASRTPFLTTDVGNAAEIIDWTGAGILLPTKMTANGRCKAEIAESVKVLENIFRDTEMRENLKSTGFATWENNFTWQKIAEQYENLYQRLSARGETP